MTWPLWLCFKMTTRHTNSVGTRKSAHESLFALFGLVLPMSRFRLELGPLHVAICRDTMQSTPRISNHHRHLVCNLAKTYLDQMVWVVTERTWSMLRSSGWGKIIRPQWVHRDIGVAQEVNRESVSGCPSSLETGKKSHVRYYQK